ncbi:MAG: STAS domain-containing protein [Pirellulaceae bacterium]|nr:STAS domain-containing protein [Pirellulaceae bacterium]
MLEHSEENGISVVHFLHARILDEATVQSLGSELVEAAARAKTGKFLLNFSNVLLMSSAMIGKLIDLRNRCKKNGIQLAFCGITSSVGEVFKIMKISELVEIYSDKAAAIKAMQDV